MYNSGAPCAIGDSSVAADLCCVRSGEGRERRSQPGGVESAWAGGVQSHTHVTSHSVKRFCMNTCYRVFSYLLESVLSRDNYVTLNLVTLSNYVTFE